MRAARRVRGSQTCTSSFVTTSTAPACRKSGHPGSRSGPPSEITARPARGAWSRTASSSSGGRVQPPRCVCLFTHVGAFKVAFPVAWHVTYLCLLLFLCVCLSSSSFLSHHGVCCVTLPPALMAYREREEGAFLGVSLVGGCAGVVLLVLLACPWPCHPRGVRGSGLGLVLPRHTLLVYASVCGHTRARGLCVWWWWCALRWRVAPFSKFRGGRCSSYHRAAYRMGHSLGIPSIPLMFRSSVLVASYSSCVLWRCPHFLWRWRLPAALMAYGERKEGEGVFHGAISVDGCACVLLAALCVYFLLVVHLRSFYPHGVCSGGLGLVIPRHTLPVYVCVRGHTTLALFAPSGLWFACLVAVVCSLVACGSLLSILWGCLSYHHFSPLGLHI